MNPLLFKNIYIHGCALKDNWWHYFMILKFIYMFIHTTVLVTPCYHVIPFTIFQIVQLVWTRLIPNSQNIDSMQAYLLCLYLLCSCSGTSYYRCFFFQTLLRSVYYPPNFHLDDNSLRLCNKKTTSLNSRDYSRDVEFQGQLIKSYNYEMHYSVIKLDILIFQLV